MGRLLLGFAILVFALGTSSSRAQDAPAKKSDSKKATEPDFGPADGKLLVSPEKLKEILDQLQKTRDKVAALERQQKAEKSPPSACKLTGKLDGDVVALRAEILFATQTPNRLIFLGLKNAFLIDEGQLDDMVPHLEAGDEGLVVRVEKEGTHRLILNLKTAVAAKRSPTSSNERGFDLGLPGSAVTTLQLELTPAVKEIRWNETPAIAKTSGRWDLTVGAQKNLSVTWKEPATTRVIGLGATVRAAMKVKLEEGRLELTGDVILEDSRGQAREWLLLLPAQAKVSPGIGGAAFNWTPPDGKSQYHSIKMTEPGDKVTLSLQAFHARVGGPQKIPIGPILAQGTATQGTILVQAAPGVLRGQRLVYHRFGEVIQRDPPKATPALDNLALFEFWNATAGAKELSPSKAPLELEWKTEKGQIDAVVEHELKLRNDAGRWTLELESRFTVQTPNSGLDTLDLRRPQPELPSLLWLATQPGLPFPGTLRWPANPSPDFAFPIKTTVTDGGEVETSVDFPDRLRVRLNRGVGEKASLKLVTQSILVGEPTRFLVELPRLAGIADRGGKIMIEAPAGKEFLVGPAGQEEPVATKFSQSFDQMPTHLDLTWRAVHRERPAQAEVNVVLRKEIVGVRQKIILPASAWTNRAIQSGQIPFVLPERGFPFSTLQGVTLDPDKNLAWIELPKATQGKHEFELSYELRRDEAADANQPIRIPVLWPEGTTRREAKVRVSTEPGTTPIITGLGDVWHERPLEEMPGLKHWPALVVAGLGTELPLEIRVEATGGHRLPSLVCDRAAVRIQVDEEGSQTHRYRFLARKFGGSTLDIELPIPWHQAQPVFRVAGKEIEGVKEVDASRNRIQLPLAIDAYPTPVLLEIEFQIPASLVESRRFWQTPIAPIRFVDDVFLGPTRWQIAFAGGQTPFLLGPANVDYRWSPSGYLLSPEPSATSTDLDAWIGATDPADEARPVHLSWWRGGNLEPFRVHHFSRQTLLIVCSGTVLLVGLLLLLFPPSRLAFGLIVIGLGLALAALGMFHEYLLPVLFLGAQPGLVVLALVACVHWLHLERRRRSLLFNSTFTRVPPGSTVTRAVAKIPRDPSTVDAPTGAPASNRGVVP